METITWKELQTALKEKGGEVIVKAKQLSKIMKDMNVAEVVRCKDCKYRQEDGICSCAKSAMFVVGDKDFCSKGKIK